MSDAFCWRPCVAACFAVLALGWFPAVAQDDGADVPWTLEGLRESFTPGTKILYSRSGNYVPGVPGGGTHTFEITDVSDEGVHIVSSFDDPENEARGNQPKRWNWDEALFYLHSVKPDKVEVMGTETVETRAGTFDTVVVLATKEWSSGNVHRQTYWLIPDQPGVYARFSEEKSGKPGFTMTLLEVVRP